MPDRKTIEALGGWKGYRVERVVWPEGDSHTVMIHLKPSAKTMHCEHCGGRCRQVHETTVRRVRDLPLFALRVVLLVPRRRVWCERCGGPRLEKLSWLGRYQRVTNRLAGAVSQLLLSSNILGVARFFQLGWHTVNALDKAALQDSVREPDWSQIRYLAMDEFALHKGHRYATVVVDPISRQVLWVGQGRSRETTRAFFAQLPAGVAEQIQAVAIDMTTAYELEIKAHCPNAEIVFDLFHVVAKYGREVINRVRVDQANRLRHDRPARRVINPAVGCYCATRATWRLPRLCSSRSCCGPINPCSLLISCAMSSNGCGFTGGPAGPGKRGSTGSSRPKAAASRHWHCSRNGSRPFCTASFPDVATRSTPALSKASTTPSRSSSAGAYGYRDQEYFFLKIRAAFPGIPR